MVTDALHIEAPSKDASAEKDKTPLRKNAESLYKEIEWFTRVVNKRLEQHFRATGTGPEETQKKEPPAAEEVNGYPAPPGLQEDISVYAEFVKYYHLSADERLLLMLALTPHIQPHLLDVFFSLNKATGRGYTEFGGIKGNHHGGFLPTFETALFLIAGNNLEKRFRTVKLFEPDHFLWNHGILVPGGESTSAEPYYSNPINLSDEYIDFFTTGKLRKPQFSTAFPAKLLTTQMSWSDLVVDEHTMKQLDEIKIWLQHGSTLLWEWEMSAKIKPGYKTLFHGPPGTGKTLTAALLGKLSNLDVYRIDLSMVVSKYIGETEKNLEKVFTKAEYKNWILFFDEADALFGKRTGITDAHDKYANQEIAYLLQRLEDYPGLVILASNMRNNVDEAFTRRLQSIIYFKKPQAKERFRLWKNSFSPTCHIPSDQELERLAQQYEISGGNIMNVVQYASLMALNRNDNRITLEDITQGIRKEFNKEGKTL
jgi:hypothetical protein